MEVFYENYLKSVDPTQSYKSLINRDIIFVIVFHVILYFIFYKFIIEFFEIKDKSNILIPTLIMIMVLGYIGRLMRSKSIFNYYIKNGNSTEKSKTMAMHQINNAYFSWYFLG